MKNFIKIFLFSAVLLIGIVSLSCQNNTEGSETTTPSELLPPTETTEITDNTLVTSAPTTTPNTDKPVPETTSAPVAEFIPTSDLTVVSSFIYDNDTYVVVENTGSKPIIDFSIAYIHFDNNGFLSTTASNRYESGKYTSANLMPGAKTIGSWYGASGKYATAVVTYIKYSDGTEWKAEHISKWADTQINQFTVDAFKQHVASLKDIAAMANSNPYLTLTDYSLVHENRFSTDFDLNFSLSNTSSQGILHVSLYVLEFDENGFPVSVSPYDTYCRNGHYTGGTINLASGKGSSYTDDLFIDGTTSQIKIIITDITFQDDSEWENPYFYEWLIYNNSSMY